MHAALDGIHDPSKESRVEITMHFNDLPSNDFSGLVKSLEDPTGISSHPAFRSIPPIALVSPKSFYSRCLPKNSLHLGFSFFSLHWLPCPRPPHNSIVTQSDSISEAEAAYMDQHAHSSLVDFLSHRSAELVVGGRLVLTTPRQSDMLNSIDLLWKAYLTKCNLQHETFSLVIPAYHRNTAQLHAAIKACPLLRPVLVKSISNETAKFDTTTLRGATFNLLLKATIASMHFPTSQAAHSFVENFYTFIEHRWPKFTMPIHLLVLEKIDQNIFPFTTPTFLHPTPIQLDVQ
ncbi:hypothetical protein DSO57_1029693 [Entomophthora muscae]|uniref:Uncharacterized protein n=1 Tax=Entomophthora muscae TaxID=34485 RepID=A0ACC2RFV9_9FUNG|nr:hypothetical protein DSO57_1029693 [Entomophthora muscae]